MGWLDSLLGFFGLNFNLKHHDNTEDTLKEQSIDDPFFSAPAAKRFKNNQYPNFGGIPILGSSYLCSDNMSPKQYFSSRRKVPAPRKSPPLVQINETDDEDEIQVISNTSEFSKAKLTTKPNGSAQASRDNSRSPSPSRARPNPSNKQNDEDEIQVISSDSDDIQIDRVLSVSPCSSRSKIKNKPNKPDVYPIEDGNEGTHNNKENKDDIDEIESKPMASRAPVISQFPRWTTAHDIPRHRESSFLFKKKNPHERPSTLQQIQSLQSREDYARLLQAISYCTSNSSTRDNTIAASSSRNSPTPSGSEVDVLDRLSSDVGKEGVSASATNQFRFFSAGPQPLPDRRKVSSAPLSIQSRPSSNLGRHISINMGNKSSYVDVGKAAGLASKTNQFRFFNNDKQPDRRKMFSTSQNKEDKIDAMIRRIQSIDLHRFDANISRSGLALDKTNEKVRSLEIPSYNVLLEKTINLRKVPERLQPKKEEPKLPEITKELWFHVRTFKAGSKPDQVVSKIGLEEITKDQILSLEGLSWLKDNVINCYMALLMKRSEDSGGTLPKVYGFNTFFHTALNDHGYSRVKRWTKKVDLFSYDIIFVPIHVQKIHWCLAAIDFRKKCVTYYDSMAGGDRGVNQRLLKYLADESMDKKKVPFDISSWSTQCPKDIPQQENSCDCGVFTSTFAEYLARNADIYQVKQENMPYYRKKMLVEILLKTLLIRK